MREYAVRLTIRTNDRGNEPDDNPPYYADQEMAREIRRWFDEALTDRDDQPEIIWSEFVLRGPVRRLELCDDCGHAKHPAGPCRAVTDHWSKCRCGERVEA